MDDFIMGMEYQRIKELWAEIEKQGIKDIVFTSPEGDWIEKEPPVYEEDRP